MSETIPNKVTHIEELHDSDCPDEVILNAVPENKKKEVKEALMVIRSEVFSGPIPPPEALARYEEIQSGAADRIIKMAKNSKIIECHLRKKPLAAKLTKAKEAKYLDLLQYSCV